MYTFSGEVVRLLFPTAAGLSLLIFSSLLPERIDTADFTSEVRPILSRQCLPCHGPDAATRKKDLRLDIKDQLLGVIEVGSAGSSPLFQRISSDDPELRMPPPDHAKALSNQEISILKQWIDAGAAWEEHWAFTPPVMPAAEWNTQQHPIDVFIEKKISANGLSANGPASADVLIRRLSLDLIGLPPDPERVSRFIEEYSRDPAGAWKLLIDELLASESFGERWASAWLDLARYADTKGYEQDGMRNIWPWRDWVIEAFDRDLPFDQFTILQLAGDLIDTPDESSRLATAFHRNTMTNDEGGTQNEEFRVAAVVDRVNTTMQVWQGLTAGCAQCHDHKYDPLSQVEYYQLYDFFNQSEDADLNSEAPLLKVLGNAEKLLLVDAHQQVEKAQQALDQAARALVIPDPESAPTEAGALDEIAFSGKMPTLCQAQVDGKKSEWPWVQAPPDAPDEIHQVIRQSAPEGQTRQVFFERSLHTHVAAQGDRYHIDARIVEPPEWMLLQVRLADPSVWEHRGYWGTGTFAHGVDGTESLLFQGELPATGDWVHLVIDAESIGIESGKIVTGIAMTQQGGVIEWGGVRRESSQPTERDDLFSFSAFVDRWGENPSDLFEPRIRQAIGATHNKTDDEFDLETWWKQQISTEGRRLLIAQQQLLDQAMKRQVEVEAMAVSVPVMTQLATEKLRSTHLLERGSYLSPGDLVAADIPQFLPAIDEAPARNRLALARWLVSPRNPLTARVHVNRVWEQLFGTGLVETLEDFGTQGALPSHPQLLDWLALTWQQEDGWSHKELLRRIVTSDTYRRSSRRTPLQQQIDPDNRLLSHATRVRLPAELVRDQALAIGGILSPKKFGPSVYPPQPDGIWQVVYNGSGWKESEGEDRVRRSLYTFFRRTAPYPSMLTFDAPTRDVCTPRRIRTNTPLQALVVLNDPVYIEAAAGLARWSLAGSNDLTLAIQRAFQRATCRQATPQELELLMDLTDQQKQVFQLDPASADSFLESGRWTLDDSQNPIDAATLMVIANVLLNLDEVLVRG